MNFEMLVTHIGAAAVAGLVIRAWIWDVRRGNDLQDRLDRLRVDHGLLQNQYMHLVRKLERAEDVLAKTSQPEREPYVVETIPGMMEAPDHATLGLKDTSDSNKSVNVTPKW